MSLLQETENQRVKAPSGRDTISPNHFQELLIQNPALHLKGRQCYREAETSWHQCIMAQLKIDYISKESFFGEERNCLLHRLNINLLVSLQENAGKVIYMVMSSSSKRFKKGQHPPQDWEKVQMCSSACFAEVNGWQPRSENPELNS